MNGQILGVDAGWSVLYNLIEKLMVGVPQTGHTDHNYLHKSYKTPSYTTYLVQATMQLDWMYYYRSSMKS